MGSMAIRPMPSLSLKPTFCQLAPPSIDRYAPFPSAIYGMAAYVRSPVPTQTTFGSDEATVTHAIASVASRSKMGVQLSPAFVVFHTPPVPAPTYITFPGRPRSPTRRFATAMSLSRPPPSVGPSDRHR